MFSATTKTAAGAAKASAENDIKSNVKAAKASGQRIYDSVRDDIGDYADEADHRVRDLADKARDRIKDARGQFDDATHRLNDRINDKPVPSALVALGVGLVLGLFVAGSQRRRF